MPFFNPGQKLRSTMNRQADGPRAPARDDCLDYPLVRIDIFVAPPAGLSRCGMRAII